MATAKRYNRYKDTAPGRQEYSSLPNRSHGSPLMSPSPLPKGCQADSEKKWRMPTVFCCRLLRVHHAHPTFPEAIMANCGSLLLLPLLLFLPSVSQVDLVGPSWSDVGGGRRDPDKTTVKKLWTLQIYFWKKTVPEKNSQVGQCSN